MAHSPFDSAAPPRLIPTNHTPAVLLLAVALAGTLLAVLAPQFRLVGLGMGLVGFFGASTLLGNAGRIARSLRPFIGRTVGVEVWGTPLPGSDGNAFEIDSVLAAGVGLLIYLRPASGGPRILLKVAQPTSARWDADRLEMDAAGYVSWGGNKLKQAGGARGAAVALTMA